MKGFLLCINFRLYAACWRRVGHGLFKQWNVGSRVNCFFM